MASSQNYGTVGVEKSSLLQFFQANNFPNRQLPDLYLSSSLEEGKTLLLALTCNLCQDPVVAVRKTACKGRSMVTLLEQHNCHVHTNHYNLAVGRFFARFQPSESSEVVSSWILDPRVSFIIFCREISYFKRKKGMQDPFQYPTSGKKKRLSVWRYPLTLQLPPSVKKLKGVTNKPPEFLSPVKKDELSSFRADLLAKMKAYAHNRSYQNRLTLGGGGGSLPYSPFSNLWSNWHPGLSGLLSRLAAAWPPLSSVGTLNLN